MIPMQDLSREDREIGGEIDHALRRVVRSGRFIMGPEVHEFERSFAEYCNCRYALGVASGSDALLLSLLALGIGAGDEVITTPFTFVATASSISRTGAIPIFVDIDPRSYNIDAEQIAKAVTRRTKAILPVHLFGQPSEMSKIISIAEEYSLSIIGDAAQAIGAQYKNRGVGELGDAATLSFFPTKNLGAFGDGGAVLTNRDDLAARVDLLRRQGASAKYYHICVGLNSRLDELQAAVLKVKLAHLDNWTERRRESAYRYNSLLADLPVITPYELPDVKHVYHQYTIRVHSNRAQLREYLLRRGIETAVYYPFGLHSQPIYKSLGYAPGSLPITELLCEEVVSLPLYPYITADEQIIVANSIKAFYAVNATCS
jgi:dTDP-4-amino-4,6-dideoxygalactose transaminase